MVFKKFDKIIEYFQESNTRKHYCGGLTKQVKTTWPLLIYHGDKIIDDKTKHAWMIVTAGFFLILVLYGSYYSFGVFLKPMINDLGWTRAMTSGVISVYMVVHGLSSIITGSLSDKYGPRLIVGFCTLIVALGYILISGIKTSQDLYIYFGLMVGAGMGAAYVPPVAAVTRWFTSRSGLAIGIVGSGVGLGQMIYPPLIRYLISSYGWRTAFVIMGIIIGIIGLPAALLLKHPPKNSAAYAGKDALTTKKERIVMPDCQTDMSARKAIITRPFLMLLYIFMTLLFGISTIMAHLVAHVEDSGFEPMKAAFVITLIGAGGIIGRIVIGGAADRFGSKLTLSTCLAAQMLLFFMLIPAKQLRTFYLIGACYGLSYGGSIPNIIILNSKFFGTYSAGKIFGILFFGAMLGGAVGAPFTGYIYDITDEYSIAFFIGGILILTAYVLSIMIKPPDNNSSF